MAPVGKSFSRPLVPVSCLHSFPEFVELFQTQLAAIGCYDGPVDGTGIEVTDLLPNGYTYLSHLTGTGAYDSGTGVWTVGGLLSGGSATLNIIARLSRKTASIERPLRSAISRMRSYRSSR